VDQCTGQQIVSSETINAGVEILLQLHQEGGNHAYTTLDWSYLPNTWDFLQGESAPICMDCGAGITILHIAHILKNGKHIVFMACWVTT
jgi:hypothetical protein